MTTRRRQQEEQLRRRAGPLGLAAMLVVGVVAYVAFTALSGLPLQSRYRVTVVVPDANRLIAADDVKSGGVRVGQVDAVTAIPPSGTQPARARIRLSLDGDLGKIPADSAVRVRSASPLGATYLELTLGRSARTVPDGGTLPAARVTATNNLVDLFDLFDRGTRRDFRRGVRDLSDGLSDRGSQLNATVANVQRLLPPLTHVARLLSAPSTRLAPFIESSARLADALAPVSGRLAALVADGSRTFSAIAGQQRALGDTIDAVPATERSATVALNAARPGLDRLARISTALRSSVRRLPRALDSLDGALRSGTPVLQSSPSIAGPLQRSLQTIARVAHVPSTDGAVRQLTGLFGATNDVLDALVPAQTQCNIIPLFFQQFASYIGVMGVGEGPSMLNIAVDRSGATGDEIQSAAPSPNLHVNYVPHENHDECEAGNEPFDGSRQLLANPAGLQTAHTRESTPPPHVLDLARNAGLLDTGEGGR